MKSRQLGLRAVTIFSILGVGLATQMQATPSYSVSVFATGAAVNATAPDSVTYDGSSIWVEYGNGASSTDSSGSSTIVQYSKTGAVQDTYTLNGSIDGLKYNPNSGQIWALHNQDAQSYLNVINPVTKSVSVFNYGTQYTGGGTTGQSTYRGFDDVAFIGNKAYMSLTNPASPTDPVLIKLNNLSNSPSTPLTYTTVLAMGTLPLTDPDSLKTTPTGLVQTGGGDNALNFINNVGLPTQTVTSVSIKNAAGAPLGPDDGMFATASSGTFYMTDTKSNTVYAITATGLRADSSFFVDAGKSFNSLDLSTGIATPIFTGVSPHGMDFVATSTPEPSTLLISAAGLVLAAGAVLRRRKSSLA